jgi:WASH complex subunit 7
MAGSELDDIFASLRKSFSTRTDYLKTLVKVLKGINTAENKHLNLFYLIIPVLTINYVINLLRAKEKLSKRNEKGAYVAVNNLLI